MASPRSTHSRGAAARGPSSAALAGGTTLAALACATLAIGCGRVGFGDAGDPAVDAGLPPRLGQVTRAVRFGGAQNDAPRALAIGAGDQLFLTGVYDAAMSFGGPILPGAGGNDVFVVALDASWAHLWSRGYGSGSSDLGLGLAPTADGRLVVVGRFVSSIDPGGGLLLGTSARFTGFAASYQAATGAFEWAWKGEGPGQENLAAEVVVASDGRAFVVGRVQGAADLGGGPRPAFGATDMFVACLDAAGGHVWDWQRGGSGSESGSAIAFAPNGDLVAVGQFSGTADLGAGALTATSGADGYAIAFSPDGTVRWTRAYGGSGEDILRTLIVDGEGNVIAAGGVDSMPAPGGVMVGLGMFVVGLSPDGSERWRIETPTPTAFDVRAVAPANPGGAYVAGRFEGTIQLGEASFTSRGGRDIFLAVISRDGVVIDARTFGGPGNDEPEGMAVTSRGDIVLTGSFESSIDFGVAPLTSAGLGDVFVIELTTTGP